MAEDALAHRPALPWLARPLLGAFTVLLFAFALARLRLQRPSKPILPPGDGEDTKQQTLRQTNDEPKTEEQAVQQTAKEEEPDNELARYSMKELRALVVSNGGSLDGLLERRELEQRARQVLAQAANRAAAFPPLAGNEHDEDEGDDGGQEGSDEEQPIAAAPTMTRKDIAKAEKKKRKAEYREYILQEIQRKREAAENKKRLQEEEAAEKEFFRKQNKRATVSKPVVVVAPPPIADEDLRRFLVANSPVNISAVESAFPTCTNLQQRLRKVAVDVNAIISDKGLIRVISPEDLDAMASRVEKHGSISVRELLRGL